MWMEFITGALKGHFSVVIWPDWLVSSKIAPKSCQQIFQFPQLQSYGHKIASLHVFWGAPIFAGGCGLWASASWGFFSAVARQLGCCAIGPKWPATCQWCGLSLMLYLEIKALLILHFHSSGQNTKDFDPHKEIYLVRFCVHWSPPICIVWFI